MSRKRKEHPADAYHRAQVAAAVRYAVHFRKSAREAYTREAATLEEAQAIADELNRAHGPARRACVYAINAEGVAFPIGEGYRRPRAGKGKAPWHA